MPHLYSPSFSGREENHFGKKFRIYFKEFGRIDCLFGASASSHSIRTTQIEKQENSRGHLNARWSVENREF